MQLNPRAIYLETCGKPRLRAAWEAVLWEKLERAQASGRLTNNYKRFLVSCLRAAGADIDNDPAFDGDWGDRATKT